MSSTGLRARVDELVFAFREIAVRRMRDMPLMNRALAVEAVDFEPDADAGDGEPATASGVLVTPWFMNLVVLPLRRCDRPRRIGSPSLRACRGVELGFLAAHEPAIGNFDTCSLFSPMFEFPDPSAARATAVAVLTGLRPGASVAPPAQSAPRPGARPPARRSFLIGRTAAGSGVR